MIELIISIIVTLTTLWVYWDAVKNNIGKTTQDGFNNIPAGGWAGACLLLWIVGFPLYLIKRKELIQKAKEFPSTEVKNFNLKIFILAIIGSGYIFFCWINYSEGTALSPCDAPEVSSILMQAMNESAGAKLSGVIIKEISNPSQSSYDASQEKRICHANAVTDVGNVLVNYSVEWQNKDERLIWVQTIDK